MDVKKYFLSYYDKASEDFYITHIKEPKDALFPHSHAYFQIYYIISGKLVHHVEEFSADLSGGEVFILPPDVPHYIENHDNNVEYYSMSFMPEYFSGLRDTNKLISDFLQYLITVSRKSILLKFNLPADDVLFVDILLKRILSEFSGNKKGKDEVVRGCAEALLSLFARIYFEQEDEPIQTAENREAVLYCVEYIKNHCDEALTLDEMCRRFAMSKTRFCKLFKIIVGTSFNNYLNNCRIQKAALLIQEGERITVAAQSCGYEYFSTFYRNFVDVMGISPTEYRNTHLSNEK